MLCSVLSYNNLTSSLPSTLGLLSRLQYLCVFTTAPVSGCELNDSFLYGKSEE